MKVLVVGGGGREHALCWKLSQSPEVKEVYCTPGNGGISRVAECVPISPTDIEGLCRFASEREIDLTVVGPELPLAMGIVDFFRERGLKIFGPTRAAAQIEASKAFAKQFMERHGIPTAPYRIFSDPAEAISYIREEEGPFVVKADGLAGGKGAIVTDTREEALKAVDLIMVKKAFGDAGERVVVERRLYGEEASFIVLTDGERFIPLPTSQDHKPVFDDDKGPNTGGMGAYSPAPLVTPELERRILQEIMAPAIRGMAEEGRPYRGVLYAGLMIDEAGNPWVLEFNCRFGDPETQPQVVRVEEDMVPLLEACVEGELPERELRLSSGAAVCVVMASGGYPGRYEKGKEIRGLEEVEGMEGVVVFHAGTVLRDGKFYTAGGRVLGVTGVGDGIAEAMRRTYEAVAKISWEGVHFRKDIGRKALRKLSA